MPDVASLPQVPANTPNLRIPAVVMPAGLTPVAQPVVINPQSLAGRGLSLLSMQIVSGAPALVATMTDGTQQTISLAPLLAFLQNLTPTSQNIAPDGGVLPNPDSGAFPLP